jgi:hypothetical protein
VDRPKAFDYIPCFIILSVPDVWSMQITTWLRLWDFHTPSPGQNGASFMLNSGYPRSNILLQQQEFYVNHKCCEQLWTRAYW